MTGSFLSPTRLSCVFFAELERNWNSKSFVLQSDNLGVILSDDYEHAKHS